MSPLPQSPASRTRSTLPPRCRWAPVTRPWWPRLPRPSSRSRAAEPSHAGEEQERLRLLLPARASSLQRRPAPLPASRATVIAHEPCSCMTTWRRLWNSHVLNGAAARGARSCPAPVPACAPSRAWPLRRVQSSWPPCREARAAAPSRAELADTPPRLAAAAELAHGRRRLHGLRRLGGRIFGSSPRPPLAEHSVDDSVLQLRRFSCITDLEPLSYILRWPFDERTV